MYVLARGQCWVSHEMYDQAEKKSVEVGIGEVGPGTLIGRYMFEDMTQRGGDAGCNWRETVVGVSACQFYFLSKQDIVKMPPEVHGILNTSLLMRQPVTTDLWRQIPLNVSQSDLDVAKTWSRCQQEVLHNEIDFQKIQTTLAASEKQFHLAFGHRNYAPQGQPADRPSTASTPWEAKEFAIGSTRSSQASASQPLSSTQSEKSNEPKVIHHTWL